MKKLILFFILLIIILLIPRKEQEIKDKQELRGIYISYIEISKYLKDKDENTSKENILKMINNIKEFNCNTIIIQVRPSSDAIYYSNIFPISKYLSSNNYYSYDVLKYIIEKSHEKNIKVYAWINPYRISTTSNIDEIKENNPAYKYINTDTIYINNGIYFNPSKKEVEDLIIDGVKEVLNYNIDGLLFDDYFYPSDDIDLKDYENNKNRMTLEEYHLNIVNHMIKRTHNECKRKNIPFGVAPDGNIENNYHKNYADVKEWMKKDDYLDFIAPQIYYGFTNSNKPFIDIVNEWRNIKINKDINFYISLAFYKVGLIDNYANAGKEEWIKNDNIIMKEIIYLRSINDYKGFILYRYDNIFDEETYQKNSMNEIKSVKKILK